jgi:hypothetical protein
MLNDFGFSFHHFGLAVAAQCELQASAFYRGLGYCFSKKIYDDQQNVHLIWCTHDVMPSVEIILPGYGNNPLAPILKDKTEAIYHQCLLSSDILNSLLKVKEAGLRVVQVAPPKKAVLFDNLHVSFYYIKGIGLVEVLESN